MTRGAASRLAMPIARRIVHPSATSGCGDKELSRNPPAFRPSISSCWAAARPARAGPWPRRFSARWRSSSRPQPSEGRHQHRHDSEQDAARDPLMLSGWRSRQLLGVDLSLRREATYRDFMRHQKHVSATERQRAESRLDQHGVTRFRGSASFADPHTVGSRMKRSASRGFAARKS